MDRRPSQPPEPEGETMSRNLFFVLLLATGLNALADKKPGPKHSTGAAEAQAKKAAMRGQTEESQAKSKATEVNTEEPQAEIDHPQGRNEAPETPGPSEAAAQAQTDKDGKLISVP